MYVRGSQCFKYCITPDEVILNSQLSRLGTLSDFPRLAKVPGVIVRAYGNTTQGWNMTLFSLTRTKSTTNWDTIKTRGTLALHLKMETFITSSEFQNV